LKVEPKSDIDRSGSFMDKNSLTELIESLTERERNALKEAISVIWLDDSSDYLNGLWDVVRIIVGSEIVDDEDFNLNQLIDKLTPFAD
jgi:hypothetical protein